MKRVHVFLFTFLALACQLFSQTTELWLKSSEKGLYLDHKVTPKENFYSVGRLFNVSAKDIAAFNNLDMTKGLNLDQVIRIPLTSTNFTQTESKGLPVYSKAGEKDGLQKISAANNNVSQDKLRKWNNLVGDKVSGNKLIVGFLTNTGLQVSAATTKKDTASTSNKTAKTGSPPVNNKIESPAKVNITLKENPAKPDKAVKVADPVTTKKAVISEPENNKKDTVAEPVTTTEIKPVAADPGYFKSSFDQQAKTSTPSKNETVTAGIFKTASGWQDAKYYLLADGIQPGTIVRIVNPDNNRIVFAKVLGEMSGIRQNEGYNIRISNSAASMLQVGDNEKFIVKINY